MSPHPGNFFLVISQFHSKSKCSILLKRAGKARINRLTTSESIILIGAQMIPLPKCQHTWREMAGIWKQAWGSWTLFTSRLRQLQQVMWGKKVFLCAEWARIWVDPPTNEPLKLKNKLPEQPVLHQKGHCWTEGTSFLPGLAHPWMSRGTRLAGKCLATKTKALLRVK